MPVARWIMLLAMGWITFAAAQGRARAGEGYAVVWREGAKPQGEIAVRNGTLDGPAAFDLREAAAPRLEFTLSEARLEAGSSPTLVRIGNAENPFSFYARDVNAKTPIVIPAYGVAVTERSDVRDYAALLAQCVGGPGRQTMLQRAEAAPETSFETAAEGARDLYVPTWLGMSRDLRVFQISLGEQGRRDGIITPKMAGMFHPIPEMNPQAQYNFVLGRGLGPMDNVRQRLEEGTLPILTGTLDDESIQYEFTMFTGLEKHVLSRETLKGTPFIVATGHSYGHMFTEEQQAKFDKEKEIEFARDEEAVLYFRTRAVNRTAAPRYAWFRTLEPFETAAAIEHDGETGLTRFSAERNFSVTLLNGKPCPQREIAVLVQPGEAAVLDIFVPHRPIPRERALALAGQDFEAQHAAARTFWRDKLAAAAQIRVPEPRIQEMIQAGLLHLDLVSYGSEPDGVIAPTIGVYAPIGSESAPIIQFYDAMGLHKQAERAIQFFFEQQRPDGFIQNFGGYQLETGPALWTAGEHYRMTNDDTWVERIKPNLLRACNYLLAWRERNKREELRGKGYGMIEGRIADPLDNYRSFMLNGYSYLGISRVAEMLQGIDPEQSQRLRAEAEAWKADIRTAVAEGLARAPVVPLGDGSWVPSLAPWAEATGPQALFTSGEPTYTHATFTCRDGLGGPIYLLFQEVLDPGEPAWEFISQFVTELFTQRLTGYSQPYYFRHDWVELREGRVKPFLQTYYTGLASLADRDTYTFHEHYFYVQPHKVHEEAWFLMQTRWMLWLETGEVLNLLPGVPRAWLEEGKQIELKGAASHFGKLDLKVGSHVAQGHVDVAMTMTSGGEALGGQRWTRIRIPHPQGKKIKSIIDAKTGKPYAAGEDTIYYDAASESLVIEQIYDLQLKLMFE